MPDVKAEICAISFDRADALARLQRVAAQLDVEIIRELTLAVGRLITEAKAAAEKSNKQHDMAGERNHDNVRENLKFSRFSKGDETPR